MERWDEIGFVRCGASRWEWGGGGHCDENGFTQTPRQRFSRRERAKVKESTVYISLMVSTSDCHSNSPGFRPPAFSDAVSESVKHG